MKAYGCRKRDNLNEFCPPSKDKKHTAKFRKTSRRLLHKQGRNDNRRELLRSIEG